MICPLEGEKAIDLRDTELPQSFAQRSLVWFAIDPPKIIQQPKDQSVCTGADVTFQVKATGDNLLFQWQKDNKNIDDSNECRFSSQQTDSISTLRIHCVKKRDEGHYKCFVKNAVEQTSHEAELTVCKFVVPVCSVVG